MLLENLTESQIKAIIEINKLPGVLFGGSIALCAYNVINRSIKDIDVISNNSRSPIFSISTSETSRSFFNFDNGLIENYDNTLIKEINGLSYYARHYSGFYEDENICLFLVETNLPYKEYVLNHNNQEHILKLLHPDYIIAAKNQYGATFGINKHIADCEQYRNWNGINDLETKYLERQVGFVYMQNRYGYQYMDYDYIGVVPDEGPF